MQKIDTIIREEYDKIKNKRVNFSLLNESKIVAPLDRVKITSPFGPRNIGGNATRDHKGIDISAKVGTPVKSVASGTISKTYQDEGLCGGTIIIKHNDGYTSTYCHMSNIHVSKGDKVSQGNIIGLSGGKVGARGSGNSQGPHLHFGLKLDGNWVDPELHIGNEISSTKSTSSGSHIKSRIGAPDYYRPNANFSESDSWPTSKSDIEEKLIELGALKFPNGQSYGYQLTLRDGNGDTLYFYHDDVYSYMQSDSYSYDLENNKIQLKNVDGEVIGYVDKIGNGDIAITDGSEPEEDEDGWSWIDYVQLVLDIAGFIPFYGDIIDVVNAVIYFARKKYLEGFLSLIAIIPVVGSVLKFGVKGAIKAASIGAKGFGKLILGTMKKGPNAIDKATKAWKTIGKTGLVSPTQLRQLGSGFDYIADMLVGTKKWAKKHDMTELMKHIDSAVIMMKNNKKGIENLYKISGKISKKQLAKSAKLAKSDKLFTRTLHALTGRGIFRRVKNIWKFTDKEVKTIHRALKSNYMDEIAKSPEKLTALIKMTKEGTAKGYTKSIGKGNRKQLSNMNANELLNHLKKLTPADRTRLSREFVEIAAETNNPFYVAALQSNTRNIKALLSDGGFGRSIASGDLKSAVASLNMKWSKSYDIMWNEMSDVLESAGFKKDDPPNGIFWPMLAAIITKTMPEFSDKVTKGAESIQPAIDGLLQSYAFLDKLTGDKLPDLPRNQKIFDEIWSASPGESNSEKYENLIAHATSAEQRKGIETVYEYQTKKEKAAEKGKDVD